MDRYFIVLSWTVVHGEGRGRCRAARFVLLLVTLGGLSCGPRVTPEAHSATIRSPLPSAGSHGTILWYVVVVV